MSQQKERVSQVASQTTEMRSLSEETIKLVKRALARGDEALAKAEQAAGTAGQAVEAVQRFLLENGIDRPRVRSIALGPANPVADNTSEDGRAQNRRVVIKLFAAAE